MAQKPWLTAFYLSSDLFYWSVKVRSLWAWKQLLPGDLEWEDLASNGGLVCKQAGCCCRYGCKGFAALDHLLIQRTVTWVVRKTKEPNTSGGLAMVVQQLCLQHNAAICKSSQLTLPAETPAALLNKKCTALNPHPCLHTIHVASYFVIS